MALNDFENTYTVAFVLKVAGLSNQFYYKRLHQKYLSEHFVKVFEIRIFTKLFHVTTSVGTTKIGQT